MSIIVVGAGIIGMLTAYELADRGYDVHVFDKSISGTESSWAGGGILSPLYPWRYPDEVTELARWSQSRYKQFSDRLLRETDIDAEWTQSGLMMTGLSSEECRQAISWARHFEYQLREVDADEVVEMVPGIGAETSGSIWMPDVAQVRNPRFFSALHTACIKKGVHVSENCPVDEICTEAGRVTGVVAGGERYHAEQVIIASGAWSSKIAAKLKVRLEIRPVRGQMLLFRGSPGFLEHVVLSDGYYLIPRRDGRILVGSTMEEVGFDKRTTSTAREELLQAAYRVLPALKTVELERQWSGLRPGSVNGIPYIGEVPGIGGLYINTGQYRNGVVTGLASARLMVDIILGAEPIVPVAPYSIG